MHLVALQNMPSYQDPFKLPTLFEHPPILNRETHQDHPIENLLGFIKENHFSYFNRLEDSVSLALDTQAVFVNLTKDTPIVLTSSVPLSSHSSAQDSYTPLIPRSATLKRRRRQEAKFNHLTLIKKQKSKKEQSNLTIVPMQSNDSIVRGFDFELLVSKVYQNMTKISKPDPTNFAEDFRSRKWQSQPVQVGQLHMKKRLELFNEMCTYIDSKAHYLAQHSFPSSNYKNEYAAKNYVVPESYIYTAMKKGFKTYERTHIALLNKIIVQNGALYQLTGNITFKGTLITLDLLFNLCDIAPSTVNSIDWVMEYHLRPYGKSLLENIRIGHLSIEQAYIELMKKYKCQLELLQTKVSQKTVQYSDDYGDKINEIIQDKDSLNYIQGMLNAVQV